MRSCSEQARSVRDPCPSGDNSLRQFFGDEFFKRFFGTQREGLIKEAHRMKIATRQEFRSALAGGSKGESVALLVRRGETNFFVGLQVTS